LFEYSKSHQGTGIRELTQKRSDAPFPSGVILYAENVDTSVFLLTGDRKGIQPVKFCTKTPW